MTFHQTIKLGIACGTLLWAVPSYAGFELVTPTASAPAAPMVAEEPPMPIAPAAPVEAAPLAAPEHVLINPYIEKLSPAANEPTDSAGLVEAVSRNQPISIAPQSPQPANAQDVLVINPYPLQDAGAHGNGMGQLSLEQAMIAETGTLRTIAVPGRQIDSIQRYSTRDDSSVPMENITPMPAVAARPVQQMPRAAPLIPQTQNTGFTEAVGFGRDLPLALALSQIVPPEYKYNFSSDIDAGATVSWQGGKPWDQVLNEMLAPSGMRAVIDGQQVVIQKG